MSVATGDQRPAPTRLSSLGTRPPEQELQLPCPRCQSTNTKFCYYNNYNLSQPRHFCKACRRYWTRGGTLRNVPVGGGSRKSSTSSNKRARTISTTNLSSSGPTTPTSTTASSSEIAHENPNLNLNPVSIVQQMVPGSGNGSVLEVNGSMGEGFSMNLNEAVPEALSLSSLLTAQVGGGGGYIPFGPGFGVDSGPGMDMHGVGFGLGLLDWPPENVCQVNGDGGGGGSGVYAGGGGGGGGGEGSGGVSQGCNTWQVGGLEGGLPDGDCFGWPDLAISMTGKGLK